MDICAFNKINILNAPELFYRPWIYCYEADPENWRHEAKPPCERPPSLVHGVSQTKWIIPPAYSISYL